MCSIRARRRLFRCLLTLALLAWAALTFNVAAQPLMMPMGGAGGAGGASVTMSHAAAACGHAMSSSTPMPMPIAAAHVDSQPSSCPPGGRGCCHGGACHCAAACSVVMAVARVDMAWQAPQPLAFVATHPAWLRASASPPFRPPIG